VVVVLADHLGQDVERSGGDDHVVHLVQAGQRLDHRLEVALGLDPDHRLPGEAELQRVRHRDDLHHAGLDQSRHSLAYGSLGKSDRAGDPRVRPAAVGLQLLDDRLRCVVQTRPGCVGCGCGTGHAFDDGHLGATWQVNRLAFSVYAAETAANMGARYGYRGHIPAGRSRFATRPAANAAQVTIMLRVGRRSSARLAAVSLLI
jgi:hypothetical protein